MLFRSLQGARPAVSGIGYTLNADSPAKVDAVTFAIRSTSASTVKARFARGGAWYTCSNASGKVTCPTRSPQLTIAGANALSVVTG